MAMSRPRTRAISLSERPRRSISRPDRSRKRIVPPSTRPGVRARRRITVRPVTDLPEPDSPTMARVWPSRTVSVTPFTARTMPASVWKEVCRSSMRRIGAATGARATGSADAIMLDRLPIDLDTESGRIRDRDGTALGPQGIPQQALPQRVLADVVFNKGRLRDVVRMRIDRQCGDVVHRCGKPDATAPDMRREPDMIKGGHSRDEPPLPEAAAEGEIGLEYVHGPALDQALEVEGRVEGLAGSDRNRAPALEDLVAGEVLWRERLLHPADAIGRHPGDALAGDIEGVVGIDIDHKVDAVSEDAAGGGDSGFVRIGRKANFDLH